MHKYTILVVTGTIYTLHVAVASSTVVNSTSTNMIYFYHHQISTSDFDQQLDCHYAIQKHIIHVTCSWHATGAILTHVTLTPGAVAASPSGPHLAADLSMRDSVHHPSVHLLAAFTSCISQSSSSFLFSMSASPVVSPTVAIFSPNRIQIGRVH